MGVKCCYFTGLKYFFCVAELEPSISALSAGLRGSRTTLLGGDRTQVHVGHEMGSASSFWIADFSLCTILKEGCFLSTLIPLIWFFLTLRWGQNQCSNKELWWCALKSTHTKFIYFSLGWRLGYVFFVQTLFLNSEAKHSLAFVGFFFFLELPFVCIGRKIALLLRISKSALLLQPWRCSYIKERKKAFKYWNSF